MGSEDPSMESSQSNTALFVDALGDGAVETQCMKCKAREWVIPLDGELDEVFLSNYLCDGCE